MFERVLFRVLKNGIDAVIDDPVRLALFMGFQRGLDSDEREALVTKLQSTSGRPNIQHGYPVKETKFPVICILLNDDRPFQHFIGDRGVHFSGDPDDAELAFGERALEAETYSCFTRQNYEVIVAAEGNPDYTIFLYELAKYVLAGSVKTLKDEGILSFDWSGGDLSPTSDYQPHYVFERKLSVTFETEYVVPIMTDVPLIRDVVGLRPNDGRTDIESEIEVDAVQLDLDFP